MIEANVHDDRNQNWLEEAALRQGSTVFAGGIFTSVRQKLDEHQRVREDISETFDIPLADLEEILNEQELRHRQAISN